MKHQVQVPLLAAIASERRYSEAVSELGVLRFTAVDRLATRLLNELEKSDIGEHSLLPLFAAVLDEAETWMAARYADLRKKWEGNGFQVQDLDVSQALMPRLNRATLRLDTAAAVLGDESVLTPPEF